MTGTYSKSMLKQMLTPVALVVVLWVSMSSVTTFYVQWLERSHQRIYEENIVSIRAAEAVQIVVWRLAAEMPDRPKGLPHFLIQWKDTKAQIEAQRLQIGQSAFSAAERQLVLKLDSSLAELLQYLDLALESPVAWSSSDGSAIGFESLRLRMIELASQVASATNELLKMNQESADRDTQQRQRISRIVYSTRLAMLVVGPLIGVFLGWRLSRLLHRSIARIAVTLHDAHSSNESDLGTIAIETSGDVQDLQQQAERVAERMKLVSHDLQNARREVLQSERLAAVGELAAGVAHEIRNPLTSVKLLLQHAIRQASGPRLDETKLELILEEIGRMETTIQGLLDFSRPPKLNRIRHDLRQTLQRALNLVEARASQQGIEIVTQTGDVPLIVDGDTEKLHQVLVNLLINAIEAMNDGGCLTIEARRVAKRNSSGYLESSGDSGRNDEDEMVQIVFEDTGQGIPSDLMPRLFEPFATSKERGTGLGLAVSHRIVDEHSGTLTACNRPQGGAQFTLTIPAAEQASLFVASR